MQLPRQSQRASQKGSGQITMQLQSAWSPTRWRKDCTTRSDGRTNIGSCCYGKPQSISLLPVSFVARCLFWNTRHWGLVMAGGYTGSFTTILEAALLTKAKGGTIDVFSWSIWHSRFAPALGPVRRPSFEFFDSWVFLLRPFCLVAVFVLLLTQK